MFQLSGSGGISNSTISGSAEANIRIENDTANLTAFNVTGTTIVGTNFTTGDDGFLVLNTGSAAMTVSVTGSTFTDNKGDHFQAASDADATGTMNITFNSNTLTTTAGNDPNVIGGGITINTSGSLDIVFQVNNNNIQQAFDDAININLDPGSQSGASMIGTISGNTIGTSGVAASGSESSNTITIAGKGAGLLDVDVTNNNVFEWGNQYGIFVGDTEGSAHVVAKVTDNILHATQPNILLINGIRVDAGATAGDSGLLEIVLTGNDVTGEGNVANGDADIRLRQRFATTIKLPGYIGANNDTAAVNAFVAANNDPAGATPAPTVSSAVNVPGGGGFIGGVATPLHAAGSGGVQASSPTAGVTSLSLAQIDTVVAAAIALWADAGASQAQLATLASISFGVADLAGNIIGEQTAGHIVLDIDAAGHGWFVDPTPMDNSEFTPSLAAPHTDLFTDPANAAAGHLDLLTAVAHEMGHQLGLPDLTAANFVHDLMHIDLADGERRLPDAGNVPVTDTAALTPSIALGPIVNGTPGNDTIKAAQAGSLLIGGAGADNFVFSNIDLHAATPAPLSHVADYSFAQGDTFDFTALNNVTAVRAVEDPSGTFATLQAHTSPRGDSAGDWTDVAQIDGAHGNDVITVLVDSNVGVHVVHLQVGWLI